MTPQDVLIKAAELLESSPTAWIQNGIARNAEGAQITAHHPSACSWCAMGAIAKVQNRPEAPQAYDSASKLLAYHLSVNALGVNIANWNDHPLRTREDVVQALRSAALQTVTTPPSH
jgi:hypothetical protein